jgi:hypothetical protein
VAGFVRVFREMIISTKVRCARVSEFGNFLIEARLGIG